MPRGNYNYSAKTKAKIALAAIKGETSLLAICAASRVSKTSALEWRDKLVAEAEIVFVPAHEHQKVCQKLKQEVESLQRVLG
jgi:1-deoxy-D-xylulose 5-phosphate reductoisomerase